MFFKNLKVGVGLQRRHQPTYQEFVKRIHDGEIGDVQYFRTFWNGSSRPGKELIDGEAELQYQIRNWYYYTRLSGDHICEQHVHNLDVANWIVGNHPIRAQGMGGREVRNEKREEENFNTININTTTTFFFTFIYVIQVHHMPVASFFWIFTIPRITRSNHQR